MDRLWVDTKTGGAIWVGNENAAKGPLSGKTVEEIEKVVGTHNIEKVAPYSKRAKTTACISQGRPLVTGVPID